MIKLITGLLGQYWVLIAGLALIGAVTFQGDLLVKKNQQIQGLEIAARTLHGQLTELQVKAAIIDKLRRAMHTETVTLKDELKVRREATDSNAEAIMLQPVSRKEIESLQWLRESIKDLNFGPLP